MSQKNLILLFTFASFAVLLSFQIFPDGPAKDYFLFSEQKITLQSHIYYASENVSRALLILSLLIATKHLQLKVAFLIFFVLEIITLADYMLTYNSGYIINDFDSNTIKLVIYSITIGGILFKDNMEKINYGKNS